MYLKKISLLNFKNIAQEELALCPGINCLVGDNGAGKTNIIDAVYYLSMCKSSLAMTDGQSVRHGADFFLAEGQYLTDAGKTESVVCSFSRKGGKVLKRNGKEYERLSDHVGLIPAVIVSPADSALISDAADERRRYLNGFISQLDVTMTFARGISDGSVKIRFYCEANTTGGTEPNGGTIRWASSADNGYNDSPVIQVVE